MTNLKFFYKYIIVGQFTTLFQFYFYNKYERSRINETDNNRFLP